LSTYVWIDSGGVVLGVTGDEEVTADHIQAVLDKRPVSLRPIAAFGIRRDFDVEQPFMLRGNDGGVSDIRYHSILTGYLPGNPSSSYTPERGPYKGRRIASFNSSIDGLFRDAVNAGKPQVVFAGFPFTRTVREVKDSTRFLFRTDNLYCYDLIVPPERAGQLYQIMLDELQRALPYTARMERRTVKVLALVTNGKGPRRSGGGTPPNAKPLTFVAWDMPLSSLAQHLEAHLIRPVVDETGLAMNVDVEWDDLPKKDLAGVRDALRMRGLDLKEVDREIDMLVIRDAQR
jgi:uncharacterized protein DUF3738